jgi:hypothetical protein
MRILAFPCVGDTEFRVQASEVRGRGTGVGSQGSVTRTQRSGGQEFYSRWFRHSFNGPTVAQAVDSNLYTCSYFSENRRKSRRRPHLCRGGNLRQTPCGLRMHFMGRIAAVPFAQTVFNWPVPQVGRNGRLPGVPARDESALIRAVSPIGACEGRRSFRSSVASRTDSWRTECTSGRICLVPICRTGVWLRASALLLGVVRHVQTPEWRQVFR